MTLQVARPRLLYPCGSHPAWRRQIRQQQIVHRRVALVMTSAALCLGGSASVGERVLGLGVLDSSKKLLVKSSRIPEGGPEDREQQVRQDVFQPNLPRPFRRFRFQQDAGCFAPANCLHAGSARKYDVVVGREYGDEVSIPLREACTSPSSNLTFHLPFELFATTTPIYNFFAPFTIKTTCTSAPMFTFKWWNPRRHHPSRKDECIGSDVPWPYLSYDGESSMSNGSQYSKSGGNSEYIGVRVCEISYFSLRSDYLQKAKTLRKA